MRISDWSSDVCSSDLGTKVERVYVNPDESELIRDRDFGAGLANHARGHHYVVELSCGLLSHAFYMLGKYGCDVECIDLFGVDEESIDFNKIVRDYIPADIQARGEEVETVRLVGDALVEAIKRKLVEESFEVSDAKTAASIAEEQNGRT